MKLILRRIVQAVPLIIGITLISFLALYLAPGDFFSALLMNPQISSETIEKMRQEFGLDKPFIVQYILWLKNTLKLNLGISLFYRTPVFELISARALNTIILSLASAFIAWGFALTLSVVSVLRRGGFADRLINSISFLSISTPSFFLAFLGLMFAAKTGLLPLGGTTSPEYFFLNTPEKLLDRLYHLILPASVLGFVSMGGLLRLMRATLLDHVDSDFVRAAMARGVSRARAVVKHALRVAINPFITIGGFEVANLLSGAALVEMILSLQGLGTLLLKAVMSQDIYVVMASILIGSAMLIGGNLVADISLYVFDPRTRR